MQKCFAVWKKMTIFVPVKELKIITGKNNLTGQREVIAGPMFAEMAAQALAAETKRRRRSRRKCAFVFLRIEMYQPNLFNLK